MNPIIYAAQYSPLVIFAVLCVVIIVTRFLQRNMLFLKQNSIKLNGMLV